MSKLQCKRLYYLTGSSLFTFFPHFISKILYEAPPGCEIGVKQLTAGTIAKGGSELDIFLGMAYSKETTCLPRAQMDHLKMV